MTKLDFDLLQSAPSTTNAIKDRQLDLRGCKIPRIENLAITQDQYDTLDLTDNELIKLDNFPSGRMQRLGTLLAANNKIAAIDPLTFSAAQLPSLHSLVLSSNSIADLSELVCLRSFPKLTLLALLDNPVTLKPFYRAFLIHTLPHLRILDYKRVTAAERKEATVIFAGSEGKQLLADITKAKLESDHRRLEESRSKIQGQRAKSMPEEERAKIKAAIANATTLEEIQRLERQLRV